MRYFSIILLQSDFCNTHLLLEKGESYEKAKERESARLTETMLNLYCLEFKVE